MLTFCSSIYANDNNIYFYEKNNKEVTVYSAVDNSVINTITLPDWPQAFFIDNTDTYVLFDKFLTKYTSDWLTEEVVCNFTNDGLSSDVVVFDNEILVSRFEDSREDFSPFESVYISYNKENCSEIDRAFNIAPGRDMTADIANKKIHFYTTGAFNEISTSFSLDAEGKIVDIPDNSFFENYNTQTSFFNNQQLLMTDGGFIVKADDYSVVANFNVDMFDQFDSIYTIVEDQLIINDDYKQLELYDNEGQITAFYLLNINPNYLSDDLRTFTRDNAIYIAHKDNNIGIIEKIALSSFSTTNSAVINPLSINYIPDQIIANADNDTLYILSIANNSIFRWSISQSKYLTTINLNDNGFINSTSIFFYLEKANKLILDNYYIDLNDDSINNYPTNFRARGITDNFIIGVYDIVSSLDFDPNIQFTDTFFATVSLNNILVDVSSVSESRSGQLPFYWSKHSGLIRRVTGGSPKFIEEYEISATGEIKTHLGFVTTSGISSEMLYSENGQYMNIADVIYDISRIEEQSVGPLFNLSSLNSGSQDNLEKNSAWLNNDLYIIEQQSINKQSIINSVVTSEHIQTINDFNAQLVATETALIVISDNNGKPIFETISVVIPDSDNDGQLDNVDAFPLDPLLSLDSDFDGIANANDPDIDGDGVLNANDFNPLNNIERFDSDNDGESNYFDNDDDNDGTLDVSDFYPTDPTQQTLNANDFLPSNEDNRWTFSNLESDVRASNSISIDDQDITPLVFPSGFKLYLNPNGDSIELYGFLLPSVSINGTTYSADSEFSTGLNLLQSRQNTGTGKTDINRGIGNKDINWTSNTSTVVNKAIEIPLGIYNTIYIKTSVKIETTIDGVDVTANYAFELWLAEGLGIVKYKDLQTDISLISANIITNNTNESMNESTNENTPQIIDNAPDSSSGGGALTILWVLLLSGVSYIRKQKHIS